MGLVGESGSGKSMTALTIMQLLPDAARAAGRITFDGIDILAATEAAMNRLRGDDIGMVFQEPMTALNPVKTIGEQVAEGIRWHTSANRRDAEDAGAANPRPCRPAETQFPLSRYPHELSGGQRQRVVIAIACALKPKLLIADEPTTALDVVLQKQILELLRDLVDERRMGLLLISHDLAVVADMADRVTIMRHGEVMEDGETAKTSPLRRIPTRGSLRRHRCTCRSGSPAFTPPGLLPHCRSPQRHPGISRTRRVLCSEARTVPRRLRRLLLARCRPVDRAGRPLGLRQVHARAHDPGTRQADRRRPSAFRRTRIERIGRSRRNCASPQHAGGVPGPLRLVQPAAQGRAARSRAAASARPNPHGRERRDMVASALHEVGLSPRDMEKYPHEFSGGQRQRISIARAIITRPRLVVADEPVSALDVSIRAQILDLFADLNQRLGVAYLFITHDLTVARAITDEVMVMHDGRIVERGATGDVLDHPQSDAAKALVAAAPDLHRALKRKLEEQG
jgi:peptide/nickel transport system ATP-binding protein